MKILTVDDSKRIRLPDAKPRQVFAYEPRPDGSISLVPVQEPRIRSTSVRFERRGSHTVGVTDRPLNMAAVKQMLAEFP